MDARRATGGFRRRTRQYVEESDQARPFHAKHEMGPQQTCPDPPPQQKAGEKCGLAHGPRFGLAIGSQSALHSRSIQNRFLRPQFGFIMPLNSINRQVQDRQFTDGKGIFQKPRNKRRWYGCVAPFARFLKDPFSLSVVKPSWRSVPEATWQLISPGAEQGRNQKCEIGGGRALSALSFRT